MRTYAVDSDVLISILPLSAADRSEFIKIANIAFERIIDRVQPENPDLTRALWNPARYVDEHLLTEEMLPISRDYALSLIDAFLVNHVISLAVEADSIDCKRPLLT